MVNEAEYHGMIEGLKMALDRRIRELIVVGDSRIAIQQGHGLIQCLNPELQLLFAPFESLRKEFKSVRLVHVKREYNAAADYVTGKTALSRNSAEIVNAIELAQLKQVNRIPEKLVKQGTLEDTKSGNPVMKSEELASLETQRGMERVSFRLTIPESESSTDTLFSDIRRRNKK
ncbi:hypothetical protein PHMEG_00010826 [Phytophthora megakarya]|uniref:RNase H type-1 domain-containing protein n=1 Tax=Phytophthora megakarya TaxID=4795 RepID=A0A225WF81_9STRA|nr:hypothetical protein PHMEG_00010826 [Phytophthora megakarya]